MATAILADFGDTDTLVLKKIWENIPAIKVIDIVNNSLSARQVVDEAIKEEKDLLIFAGHGAPTGLFNSAAPYLWDSTVDMMLLDEINRKSITAKKVIGIWCYASDFAKAQKLNGFFTSMFISNPVEASYCGIDTNEQKITAQDITQCEVTFCENLNHLITSDIPMSQWKKQLISKVELKDAVTKFNYNGLYYSGE